MDPFTLPTALNSAEITLLCCLFYLFYLLLYEGKIFLRATCSHNSLNNFRKNYVISVVLTNVYKYLSELIVLSNNI